MKKLVMTLFTAALLGVAIFAGGSEALAMDSKGTIKFKTDANTYTKRATSIVVTGTLAKDLDNGFSVIILNNKGKVIARKDILHSIGSRNFRVSFSTKNLPAGKYDVQVGQDWGGRYWSGELKHYITVQH
ncbi:hypothetical protein WYY_16442 [Bacillus velezensis M27]|uniref:hypothetical protein n=1 Tax=Bacillus TaxID=1386 RepID=UPI00024169B0|nr:MULTISPECIES: hypothetical protein [Bacillus amyloliquefaciens group]AGF28789.1 hypothetical protein KSO_016510 [Bacillus amyloliquefaciens IT-45]AJH22993.1 hypothetical protein SB45_03005 [Bacillus velezensis]AKD21241.1 hypothetical protein XM40_03030 [Bacillus velezensis]AMP30503.1 hypothetical protein AS588_00155 [Bacillus amyloliquefaciens]ASF54213.1 hypothetical protein CEG11_03470 [Bacillus velezensis]